MKKTICISVPCFSGFYETLWDERYAVESEAERLGYEHTDNYVAKSDETLENYRHEICEQFARIYVDFINENVLEKALGTDFDPRDRIEYLEYELSHPYSCNYSNDKLYAYIEADEDVLRRCCAALLPTIKDVEKVLHENHTSYDGFCSFMSNELSVWISKLENSTENNRDLYLDYAIGYIVHFLGDFTGEYDEEIAIYESMEIPTIEIKLDDCQTETA